MWLLERSALCRELLGDTEAFLGGWLVNRFECRGETVPVWAWTNLLAHGPEEALVAEHRAPQMRLSTFDDRWHAARSYLAVEVLELAEHHGPLSNLQRKVLVPLELELASDPDVGSWGPGQWVSTVRRKLEEHRRLRQRSERRTGDLSRMK